MKQQKAIFAAGCFWGVEELIRKLPGVISTRVGYCGGSGAAEALYTKVKTGSTGHAESVQVLFDAEKLSYENLLRAFFKCMIQQLRISKATILVRNTVLPFSVWTQNK